MYDLNDSPLLAKQTPYRGRFTFLVRFVLLLLTVYVAENLSLIPAFFAMLATSGAQLGVLMGDVLGGTVTEADYATRLGEIMRSAEGEPLYLAATLLGTAATAAAVLMFTLVVEKRTCASMGLGENPRKSFLSYISGALLGAVMLALSLLVCRLTGALTLTRGASNPAWLLLFFVCFLIQGASEEILIHGFVMTAFLRPGRSPWGGIIASAVIFALLHLGNSGISFIAVLNLALFALLMGVLTLRVGNLWLACGAHALWNFTQGNLFGASVSGTAVMPTLFRSVLTAGRETTHGGDFGLEGGFAATLVLLLALMVAVFFPSKKREQTSRPDSGV